MARREIVLSSDVDPQPEDWWYLFLCLALRAIGLASTGSRYTVEAETQTTSSSTIFYAGSLCLSEECVRAYHIISSLYFDNSEKQLTPSLGVLYHSPEFSANFNTLIASHPTVSLLLALLKHFFSPAPPLPQCPGEVPVPPEDDPPYSRRFF